ncbi:hypothetical protein [Paenibacillus sp. UNC451MF]|uniref:hypothetical protein n=1 Tax=Paenibacillus sp. UNC451MF TaxID=1449063 RepID=UPI00068D8510|nr:hypothetical protein [Paenibacillus sp. UNC451MF]
MKRSIVWLSCLFLWTSLLVARPLSSAAVPDNPPIPAQALAPASTDLTVTTPTFMDAVNQWMKRISSEQGFEAWKQASWTSYPLGPGTHGWIVLLKAGGAEVGYMVIYAEDPKDPNKYRLAEYGRGSTPLFSLNTLYHSLVQLELIHSSYTAERWYSGPLYAVWKVTSGTEQYYIDAKSGEVLPLSSAAQLEAVHAEEEYSSSVLPKHSITSSLQLGTFDPYDRLPWVKGTPVSLETFEKLATALNDQSRLTYVAELYHGSVTVPLAVTGYQLWSNEEAFLLLEQDGIRAIPYSAAFKQGKLFP